MDGSRYGELGVISWCNSIRLNIAKDPGRELLETQIQTQGFDFLDSYLEDVFSREKEEPVYELLKTPGKKKDAGKRTRAATAAAAKVKAINRLALEELESTSHVRTATASSSSSQGSTSSKANSTMVKKKAQKVVTIADTPEPPRMEVDDEEDSVPTKGIPAPQFITPQSSGGPPIKPQSGRLLSPPVSPPNQLAEASNQATRPLTPETHPVEMEATLDLDHVMESADQEDEDVQDEQVGPQSEVKELSMIAEDDEPSQSPVRPAEQLPSPDPEPPAEDPVLDAMEDGEDFAVPIRDVPLDPMDTDLTVPLRDIPGPSTLKRKPSMSTFSGISAPSPLRKSMRMSHDPSGLTAATHTPGAGLGKRTSWLTQAKQAKALELGSGKRLTGAATIPVGGAGGHIGKAKGGESLGLGFTFTSGPSAQSITAEESAKANNDEVMESEALAFLRKRKANSLEDNTTRMALPEKEKAQSQPPVTPAPAPGPLASADDLDDMAVLLNDMDAGEEHTLHKLKMTVKGARAVKSTGKSLGGNAAAELAAARKLAEAKIAQRNKSDEDEVEDDGKEHDAIPGQKEAKQSPSPPVASGKSQTPAPRESSAEKSTAKPSPPVQSVLADDPSRRMSLSDLIPESERSKPPQPATVKQADLSASTTPPNSPPPSSQVKPVFSQPPTVFVAPPPSQKSVAAPITKEPVFKLPVANPFSLPAPAQKPVPVLSAQSSKTSVIESIFDTQSSNERWLATQETEFSQPIASSSKHLSTNEDGDGEQAAKNDDSMDEDDSWHVDDKFAANGQWTPFGFTSGDKDDTMTWSTLPSRSTSQKGGDTGPVTTQALAEEAHKAANELLDKARGTAARADEADVGQEIDEEDLQMDGMEADEDDHAGEDMDLDDIVASGKPTITLVKPPPRAPSQQSMASTSSSQSQLGFFGQASKLVNSMLGSSKTKKAEPVKSIARAAAVAKKQQEEAEKKASRLKDMENRRQLAQQRKADEEKARAQEEERKAKEEADRRKRDKEEHTDKRPLKPVKKTEDDTTKRKLNVDNDKKTAPVKPPSKDGQLSRMLKPPSAPSTATKTGGPLKSTLSKQASTASLTAAASSSAIPKASTMEAKSSKIATSSSNSKLASAKGKTKAQPDKEDELPSKVLQAQMASRAKAQLQATQTPKAAPPVTSESIELPDINSEYSNSDDEDRPRTFDPPEWAQSPELRQQLEHQSRINPDDIFGRIGPLRMEEIFRTRQSRFRARTSSANWAGADQLTEQEEREYAKKMGFTE